MRKLIFLTIMVLMLSLSAGPAVAQSECDAIIAPGDNATNPGLDVFEDKINDAAPGDVVCVRGGVYTLAHKTWWT